MNHRTSSELHFYAELTAIRRNRDNISEGNARSSSKEYIILTILIACTYVKNAIKTPKNKEVFGRGSCHIYPTGSGLEIWTPIPGNDNYFLLTRIQYARTSELYVKFTAK